jgi:ABC-type spermidine/putrescine transport system permease subunit I
MGKLRALVRWTGFGRRWEGSLAEYSPRQSFLLLLPVLIIFFLFLVIPLLRLLPLSTMDPTFTLKHYLHLIETPLYRDVLVRTFRISLLVTLFSFLAGYPVAYLLSQSKPPFSNLMLGIVLLPMLTNWLAQVYAWLVLLQTHGVVNELLLGAGLIAQPLRLMLNAPAAILAMVVIQLPLMILPIYSVLQGIDRDLVLAARSLGASDLQAFWRVTFPLSLPGVATGVLFILILSLGYYITPAILGGPRVLMVGKLIEQQMIQLLNWPFASALAVVLLAITLVLVGLLQRFLLEKTSGGLIAL